MNNSIGNNIKKFRIKLDLTQEVLAEYLGISRVELNYYEKGSRQIPSKVITKAAELFSVDEYDLYQEDVILNANVAFAFRADGINLDDLNIIADFKRIAMNYLKMKNASKNV